MTPTQELGSDEDATGQNGAYAGGSEQERGRSENRFPGIY